MNNGLSHSGTVLCTLSAIRSDRHFCCSLDCTSPPFNPREVLARGQPLLSVWVAEYVLVRLCLWFLCGNVGCTCLPRAMLINALQAKCSLLRSPPHLLSSANLPCLWVVIAGREGEGAAWGVKRKEGKHTNKKRTWEEVHQWASTALSSPAVSQLPPLFVAVSNQYTQLSIASQIVSHCSHSPRT